MSGVPPGDLPPAVRPGDPDPAPGKGDGAEGPGERAREKAADALEFAKSRAEGLLDDVKLRKRILEAKAARARGYAAAGRSAREAFRAKEISDGVIVSLVAEIDESLGRLSRIATDEKAAAAEKPRAGFLDRLKQGAARAAGIAKHALEKSLVERDLAGSCAGLAECLLLHGDRFAPLLAGEDGLIRELESARALDRELASLERELAARGGEGEKP